MEEQRCRGRPPKPLDPEASHGARLGAKIRALRQDRGLTQKALADLIGFSFQHISEVERAKVPVSRPFVTACDKMLEADGALLELLPMVVCERVMERDERSAARRQSAGRESPTYAEIQRVARAFGLERYAGLLYPSEADGDVDPLFNRRDLFGAGRRRHAGSWQHARSRSGP